MQKWEYMWMYASQEKGKQIFIANGERLQAQTYSDALNALGKDGWELVAVIPPVIKFPIPMQSVPQFCLKRPVSE